MFEQDAKKEAGIFNSRKAAKAQSVERFTPRRDGAAVRDCSFAALRKAIVVVLLLCFMWGKGFAAAPADFDAANRLFDKEDFQGARSGYEALVKSGFWSAHLFYNLGNAAFRQGDKSAAFLAYERALALEPGHPEAKANLNFLRNETGAKLPATSWIGRALSWPAADAAAWLASAAFFGLCFSLAPLVWRGRAPILLAVFCGMALAWSGMVVFWQASCGETWIVTAEAANARTMPVENSQATATLPMGSHVRLLLERGAWLQVQLPDDSTGWISRDAVKPVRLAR